MGSLGGACRTSRYSAFRPSRRCWYLLCTALYVAADGVVSDMRRVVVRRDNTLPRMDPFQQHRTTVGHRLQISISCDDDEQDIVTFVLLRAPRYGYLLQRVEGTLGFRTEHILRSGSRIRVPLRPRQRAHGHRSVVHLRYVSSAVIPKMQYPLAETMTIAADDGGGVLSNRQEIQVMINLPSGIPGRYRGNVVAMTLASGVLLLLVIGSALYFYRKRLFKSFYARVTTTANS